MEAVVDQLSDYEQGHGKPIPSTNHAVVQQRLGFQLMLAYNDTYDVLPELTILLHKPYVPNLAIYPKLSINFAQDVLQRTDLPLATTAWLLSKFCRPNRRWKS